VLLADQAILVAVPGNAAAAIKVGQADPGDLLLLQRKRGDRSGGADLSAQGAGVFAVAVAGIEERRPEALEASLENGGLETPSGRGAHPDAFPTANTSPEKVAFQACPRRADHASSY
jgi:hypothetical protein